MSIAPPPRRLHLTTLERRVVFDVTPLAPVPVVAPVAMAAEAGPAAPDAQPGHGTGCNCGACVRVSTGDDQEAWALPPIYGSSGVSPRDPTPPYPLAQTFILHTRPAAAKKIYLDFTGHTTSGTGWNTSYNNGTAFTSQPFHIDGSGSTYTVTDQDRIQRIWQRVAEDYSPFDVDVTTEEPAAGGLTYSGAGDTTWGVRCVVSPTDDWIRDNTGGIGGIAYVPGFRVAIDQPCFVFSANLGPNDEKYVSEAISHEVGHTLGLSHDGTASVGYYTGHTGSGGPGWAPIMGVGYYQPVVQWSRGEYAGANNTQDDLAIITNTTNNFGYRPDDAGATAGTAAAAGLVGTTLAATGVIERTTDVDYWSFQSGAGTASFTFSPWVNSPNLDILAELRDSTGAVLASANPVASQAASISFSLPTQGTYYLTVDGVGVGTASNGYTDYASLGQYTIAGTVIGLTRLAGLEAANLSFTENQTPLALTATLAVAPGTDLNQATVAIGNYATGQDVLQFTNQGGITGNFDTATGILTLTGTATPAVYQTALRSITYANASDNPSTTTRSFTFRVRDVANNTSTPVSRQMTVTAVNDAPVADDESYSTNEDVQLVVPVGSGVLVGDTDPDNASLTATLVNNVQHGTLALAANGSFVYTPAANYNGPDSFTYVAGDGALTSNLGTVTLAVTAVNDAPVADADAYAVDEDGLLSVPAATGVLNGDTDVENSTLTATLVANVQHGTLSLAADGSFVYTPTPNYAGPDSFTYKANDGGLDSNVATVALTVNPINDAPVADNDSYSTAEDTQLVVPAATGVLNGDADVDNPTLTAVLVSDVQHGTLSLAANGSFTYTPAANYSGLDSFTYKATDGTLDSNVATVSLTVTAVNDPPVADNDAYAVDEDGSLSVPAATGVLNGDTDVEGSALTAVLVSTVQHGSLTLNANGSFDYTPTPNYSGPDSFTYKANDGALDSNVATVSLTVTAFNDAPVADDDAYSTTEDVQLVVPASSGVLNGDTDVDNPTLTAVLVSDVQHGTLSLAANGSFTYTPAANYSGPDSFTYKATDDTLDSNVATVSLTVTAVNDPPVADNDAYGVTEDDALSVPAATGVLNGDTDVEGSALTAVLVGNVQHGSLTLNPDGSFDYTPTPNYSGPDSFTYRASDGVQTSNLATVTLTVSAVGDAPVALGDSYTVAEDGTLDVLAPGVRGNDTDADGDPLTAVQVSAPAHGTLAFRGDGSFTYVATANYFGPDSFAYKVNDGTADSNTATVNLTVSPVNDLPVATGESYTLAEDTPLVVGTPGLLANDTDVEGGPLAVVAGAGPAHGSLTLGTDGSFTYTPAANYNGPDAFTYSVSDGAAGSNTVTVSLAVTPVNDAPTAVDDFGSVVLKKSITIQVLTNDSDVEGGPLTIQSFTQPTKGTLTRTGTKFVYTANGPLAGVDTFTYTVADPQGATATATVFLTLTDPIAPKLSAVRAWYGSTGRSVVSLQGLSRTVLPWAGMSRLEIGFSENITLDAGALTLTGPTGSVPLTPGAIPAGGTRTAVWDFTALGQGSYTLRLSGAAVHDVNGNAVGGDYVRSFGILPGDFDGNGVVDNRDLKGIKKKYQSNPAKADRFADVNGDGVVNALDYNLAKDALGHRLS